MTYVKYLKSIGACQNAIGAAQGKTAQEVWDTCERGDWMLWLCGKLSDELGSEMRRKLVLASVECARLAWPHVREQDKSVVETCYVTAEQWARGENGITLDDVRAAAHAACAVADAACAAVYAADAAYAAAHAACAAADAACAAILKQCATIVRAVYPISPAVEIIGPDN